MALTLDTAPGVEFLSTAEAKAHLRVDIIDDDAFIDNLVKAARVHLEIVMNRSFVDTTWKLILDEFPADVIRLPRAPLSSVTSVTYTDTDGASQTVATADFTVDTDSEPGRIYPAFEEVWPATRDIRNAVTIEFVAGYGTAETDVPETIRQAGLLLVGHWYENREQVIVGTSTSELPMAVKSLMWSERILEVA